MPSTSCQRALGDLVLIVNWSADENLCQRLLLTIIILSFLLGSATIQISQNCLGELKETALVKIFLDLISPGPKFALPGHIVSARTSQMIWSIEVPDDVEFVDNQAGFYNLNLFCYNAWWVLYQSCIFFNIVKKKGVANQTHVKKRTAEFVVA